MRTRLWALILLSALAALPASAQETRGTINGTVQDATGPIPGATVKITNTETNQTQSLITNSSGYFEAPLLTAGQYRAVVEMPGFKTTTQSNLVLAVSQQLSLKFVLEVGGVTENVEVRAEAPLLDTTSVSSGQNFDSKLIDGLPMAANQPILLTKFAAGIIGPTTQQYVIQGQIDGPNDGAGDAPGPGSFNYTIDGATNSGNNRRMAQSPNSDFIQEMRVETSNFDAAQGHGSGANISLMTRAGTNTFRGTVNYQYWTQKLNSLNPQQKLAFSQNAATAAAYDSSHMNNVAFTGGGPLVIPKLVDGRNRLFYFLNIQGNVDDSAARNTPTSTVPYNTKYMQGDFSDLLTIPNGSTYQIYDPLTVRADPARPGGFIRTPFAGNIIPKDRFMNLDGSYKNQMFALFADMMPTPNQNFIENLSTPTNNYYQGGVPNYTTAGNYGVRVDYNHSGSDRFFFRGNGTRFHEQLGDWTYETDRYNGLHVNDKIRKSWAYTGNWTRVMGSTVIDSQFATNRFYETQERRPLHQYKPSTVGLPTYLDDFCATNQQCMLPQIAVSGYQTIGNTAEGGLDSTNFQGQSTITMVKGAHTLRSGVDLRLTQFRNNIMPSGAVSGTYTFDNTYTRRLDSAQTGDQQIGLSLAALMLGIPSTVSVTVNPALKTSNPFYAGFVQDSWRVNADLTVNAGLRYEFENGISEDQNRFITDFDPNATLSITAAAEAAYARNPIPQVGVADFKVRGGSLYATMPGAPARTWDGKSMVMPRASFAYKLGSRSVLKGGYGLYYDVVTAADYGINQNGYSVTTTNPVSSNFGQTWLLGNPSVGISPLTDPFPIRANGSRFESPLGDSLGVDQILGSNFNWENQNRERARVQRWRIGLQREVARNLAVEVAYAGSYSDQIDISIPQRYVPESYYSTAENVRDASVQTLMQQNVPNPMHISNFAFLQTANPALYQRMAANTLFSSTTIQRHNLLSGYPHLTSNQATANQGLNRTNLPLGEHKNHSLDITATKRYSSGLSANMALSFYHTTENRTVYPYDRAPTLWQTAADSRPYRFTGGAVYELPAGSGRKWLNNGGVMAAIFGNWQTAATLEMQPGRILDWDNRIYNGDLGAIPKDNPEVSLNSDGTLDATKTWFNTDTGFEKAAASQPAQFQKRFFPFRVDGVRGPGVFLVNANFARTFDVGARRSFQFRVDVQNLFDTPLYNNPNVDPTNTNFGKVTTVTNSVMRFVTFYMKLNF
jgi:hypothetical protein